MKLSFKNWLESSNISTMAGATTTASISNYTRPLFSTVVRKELNEIIPRKRRRRGRRRTFGG